MKMALSLVAALTVSGLLLTSNVVQAEDCSITNTGPGSTNECIMEDRCEVDVNNSTDIDVNNSNDQTSTTGGTGSTGNTSGGSASSGDATNSNSTGVGVEVNNGTDGSLDCEEAVVPVPSTTVTPPVGGRGGGQVSGASTTAGGRGAGDVSGAQVAAPVGGVGAGVGGVTLSVLAASVASIAAGAYRLRKPLHG